MTNFKITGRRFKRAESFPKHVKDIDIKWLVHLILHVPYPEVIEDKFTSKDYIGILMPEGNILHMHKDGLKLCG